MSKKSKTQTKRKQSKRKTQRRLSLDELNPGKKTKLGHKKFHNFTKKSKNTNIRKSIKDNQDNKKVVDTVERLFMKFKHFKNKVEYNDDPTEIKDEFQIEMCKDGFFSLGKTICGVGSYKVVLLCKGENAECKYVYAFDFKHHPNEDGDEKFMSGEKYGELSNYDNILSISPVFHRKLYCGYKDRQRVDFMLFYNNGNELFNFLYMIPKNQQKYRMGTRHSLWLGFVLLMTCLYSFGIMHKKGYVHRDLKPENMLVGNPNNKSRNFLTITDYGFVVREDERKYDITGTPEYMTPKLSKIYERMESGLKLKFTDLIEHDLHSIGYNLVQILISDVFSSTGSRSDCSSIADTCGEDVIKLVRKGRSEDKYCNVDAMTYIACNKHVDGTLGERKYVKSLKQQNIKKKSKIDNMPNKLLELIKKTAITLSDYGFSKHFKDNEEGKQYTLDMFYQIAKTIKNDKKCYDVVKKTIYNDDLKVKLNPAIWWEIEHGP